MIKSPLFAGSGQTFLSGTVLSSVWDKSLSPEIDIKTFTASGTDVCGRGESLIVLPNSPACLMVNFPACLSLHKDDPGVQRLMGRPACPAGCGWERNALCPSLSPPRVEPADGWQPNGKRPEVRSHGRRSQRRHCSTLTEPDLALPFVLCLYSTLFHFH